MKLLDIIRQEWRIFSRSKVFITLLTVIVILSAFTLWQAWASYQAMQQSRAEAAEHMRERFLNQGAVNPHGAAHYGHFVFKPANALTMIDEGVNAFTGVTLRLEGHQQNEIVYSPAQGSGSLVRFGALKLSLVLQVIIPLLIVFVCYNSITRERDAGTLSLAITQGGSLRSLVWGKTFAYALVWLVILVVLVCSVALLATGTETPWVRIVSVIGIYAVYYFLITAFTIYTSARSKTSANALLTMMTLWLLITVLLPKASANLGENVSPLITKIEMEQAINEDNRKGINGHDPRNERSKRFQDSVLVAYKVDSVSKLSVNLDGLTMQADEEYHNKVYDRHFGNVQATIEKQNQVTALSSWINPFIPARNLSMAVSNTDAYSHAEFTRQAEQYRRKIIKIMNDEIAYGGSKTGDWDWAVKADYWKGIDDFSYEAPTLKASIQPYGIEIAALIFWVLVAASLIHFTTNRINLTT